jgi:ribosomal protein S27AE
MMKKIKLIEHDKCPQCGCTVLIFDPEKEGWQACERCDWENIKE